MLMRAILFTENWALLAHEQVLKIIIDQFEKVVIYGPTISIRETKFTVQPAYGFSQIKRHALAKITVYKTLKLPMPPYMPTFIKKSTLDQFHLQCIFKTCSITLMDTITTL